MSTYGENETLGATLLSDRRTRRPYRERVVDSLENVIEPSRHPKPSRGLEFVSLLLDEGLCAV